MIGMSFREHVESVSGKLRTLSTVINNIEADLLRFDENRNNTSLCTRIVQNITLGNSIAQEVLFGHVPFVTDEDKAMGGAIKIAAEELVRRLNGCRDDLEVFTKTSRRADPTKPKYLNVHHLRRVSPVS